jgi:DNA-binding response OmpR family regulator
MKSKAMKEEQQQIQNPKHMQLMLLKESLQALYEKKNLVGKIREANLRAAEKSNRPEEVEHIQRRYLLDLSKIETAMRRTEMQMHALEEEVPWHAAQGRKPRRYEPILVVDDEKNIRLTLSQSLDPLGLEIQTAVNGEEALHKLQEEDFSVILLDLKMPGMDGLEVLRRIRERWPKTLVIIITAHGTIDSAVEAMKLGAADFVQKPFSPKEIRKTVSQVLEREALTDEVVEDYYTWIKLSKGYIADRRLEEARRAIRNAIAIYPGRPEAYNLTGILLEMKGDLPGARRFYRAALDVDASYKPARANFHRAASTELAAKMAWGPDQSEAASGIVENERGEE